MSLEGKKISELARVTSVRDDSLLVIDNGGTESNSVYVEDLLSKASANKQDKLTAGANIKIENNVISANVITDRNIGEIVPSVLPLVDAGLHLLDGSLIDGNGIYGEFVDYIADLYEENPNANYFAKAGDVITNWTQPYITGIGTMGGNTFACYSDVPQNAGANSYWPLFNNVSQNNGFHSTQGNVTGNIYWYNPIPVNITNITVYTQEDSGGANRQSTAGTIYGSNDYINWTPITTYTNSQQAAYSYWNINLSSNTEYYKYYRWQSTACGTGGYWTMSHLVFTATQKESVSAEGMWQYYVTKYGSCGKFVYDSTNNTVRLPRIEGIIEGTNYVSELSNTVEAGLPNITGDTGYGITDDMNYSTSGPFYRRSTSQYKLLWGSGSTGYYELSFDASKSSSKYGNSDTVQPQTIKVLYYMVVASSTKDKIDIDPTKDLSELQFKAESDFSNVVKPNQSFISQTLNWMMPDYTRGIAMSSPFTAPTQGIAMYSTAGNVETRINGIVVPVGGNDTSNEGPVTIILDKGDVLTYTSDGGRGEVFYPFKGAI